MRDGTEPSGPPDRVAAWHSVGSSATEVVLRVRRVKRRQPDRGENFALGQVSPQKRGNSNSVR
jgi:hypothetical protein